jgi:hypothetical protein
VALGHVTAKGVRVLENTVVEAKGGMGSGTGTCTAQTSEIAIADVHTQRHTGA